ncbi:hypothetical protein B5M09_013259, partial [Aphanomyces astaci]
MPPRSQSSYSIDEKRKLLASFDELCLRSKFCKLQGIARTTWISWLKYRLQLVANPRNGKRKTLGGQGTKGAIPFNNKLLGFMKDVRRQEHILTSVHMIMFMKTCHAKWLAGYTSGKRDGYKSLLKLCQDLARRHRFSQRVPCFTNSSAVEMVLLRTENRGETHPGMH